MPKLNFWICFSCTPATNTCLASPTGGQPLPQPALECGSPVRAHLHLSTLCAQPGPARPRHTNEWLSRPCSPTPSRWVACCNSCANILKFNEIVHWKVSEKGQHRTWGNSKISYLFVNNRLVSYFFLTLPAIGDKFFMLLRRSKTHPLVFCIKISSSIF